MNTPDQLKNSHEKTSRNRGLLLSGLLLATSLFVCRYCILHQSNQDIPAMPSPQPLRHRNATPVSTPIDPQTLIIGEGVCAVINGGEIIIDNTTYPEIPKTIVGEPDTDLNHCEEVITSTVEGNSIPNIIVE